MTGWSDDDLRTLETYVQERNAREAAVTAQVLYLREQGCPWSIIGAWLGVSKQAAHQHYRGLAR